MNRKIPGVWRKSTTFRKIVLRPCLDSAISSYVSWDVHFCFTHTSWISTIPTFSHDRHNLVPHIWHGHANVPALSPINLLFCPVYFPPVAPNANYLSLLFMAYFQPIYLSWLAFALSKMSNSSGHSLIFVKPAQYCFLSCHSFMPASIQFLPLFNLCSMTFCLQESLAICT